jgi:alkylated DNA nucleotide flippase Atl1
MPANEERIDRILERVRAIPKGSVRTYGDIDPKAPRLVGRVLATHPARVPWHRVVRSDGSVPKGARQLDLLRREGVPILGDRVDMAKARRP